MVCITGLQDGKVHVPNSTIVTDAVSLTKVFYEGIEFNDDKNWKTRVKAMKNVVHGLHGTARGINRDLKYTMAGKTGTAQVFGIAQDAEYKKEEIAKKLQDHALFIGYAPYDNPKIAVALIVENGGGGGSVAAPIVRKVIDQYLLNSTEKKTIPTKIRSGEAAQ